MLESEPWLCKVIPEKTHSILVSCVHPIHIVHSYVFVYLSAMGRIEESVLVVLNNLVRFHVTNLEGYDETIGAKNELLKHRRSLVVHHSKIACVSYARAASWKVRQKWAYLSCY